MMSDPVFVGCSIHGNLRIPRQCPPQEIAGLIKGLSKSPSSLNKALLIKALFQWRCGVVGGYQG